MKKVISIVLAIMLVLASISTAFACETHGIVEDVLINSYITYKYVSKDWHTATTYYTFKCRVCGGERTLEGSDTLKEKHTLTDILVGAGNVIKICFKCNYRTTNASSLE